MPSPAGTGDEADEWIELYNAGPIAVDLEGWFLDDGPVGSEPYRMPDGTVLQPGAFVIFLGRITGIVLDDAGDQVRLLDPAGRVVQAVVFDQLAPSASYSRDDAGAWHDDWPPSPGGPNLPLGFQPEGELRALKPAGVGLGKPDVMGITLRVR